MDLNGCNQMVYFKPSVGLFVYCLLQDCAGADAVL